MGIRNDAPRHAPWGKCDAALRHAPCKIRANTTSMRNCRRRFFSDSCACKLVGHLALQESCQSDLSRFFAKESTQAEMTQRGISGLASHVPTQPCKNCSNRVGIGLPALPLRLSARVGFSLSRIVTAKREQILSRKNLRESRESEKPRYAGSIHTADQARLRARWHRAAPAPAPPGATSSRL